jgi:hypothetical protein
MSVEDGSKPMCSEAFNVICMTEFEESSASDRVGVCRI